MNTDLESNQSLPPSGQPVFVMSPQPASLDDEIDLRAVWAVVWNEKWTILLVTALFAVCSIFFALKQPSYYQATSLLTPAASDSGGAGGLAAQFGGIAAMAGINLGSSGGGSNVTIALELIKDWNFVDQFIRKYELEVPVFAAIDWDKQSGKLVIDNNVYDQEKSQWVEGAAPTSWQLYSIFVGFVSSTEDKGVGLIRINVEYFSPVLAAEWNRLLIKEVNQYMRELDLRRASKSIEFLKGQVKETSVADLRSIFYHLIEEQTKTVMLANSNEEYVLQTIGVAKTPEQRSKPKRTMIVILGAVLGGVLSLVYVFVRHMVKQDNDS